MKKERTTKPDTLDIKEDITITAKLKIVPMEDQSDKLIETIEAYTKACNYVSSVVFETKQLVQPKLHKEVYEILRTQYQMKSQMAQSVMKTVIARYKTNKSNGHKWGLVEFQNGEYDLVWNRDYSLLKDGIFSLNTLQGRVKVPFKIQGMKKYFDGWEFGTAKLVQKKEKFFLHIPMTKKIEKFELSKVSNVCGVDLGMNFIATSYDSKGKTKFFKGRKIKHKRSQYAEVRKQLQERKTPSSRRRLKKIGQRENRWMQDVNHCVSKALVESNPKHTLFVLEDLSGVRGSTERVRKKDKYTSVSWAYYDLGQKILYKSILNDSNTMFTDPAYTSQCCPKDGHTERANRNKKTHTFKCKTCGYSSNDDRIGGMNLHRKGVEYISKNLLVS